MIDLTKLSMEELMALKGEVDLNVQRTAGEWKGGVDPTTPPSVTPMVGIGRGFMDMAQGPKELYLKATGNENADQYSADLQAEIAQYEQGRPDPNAIDWARMVGQAAATLPAVEAAGVAAGAKALPWFLRGASRLMGTGAVQGAVTGAAMPVPAGTTPDSFVGEKAIQTGIGAAAGAVVPPLVQATVSALTPYVAIPAARLADTVQRKLRGRHLVDPQGALSAEGRDLVQTLGFDPDNLPEDVRTALGGRITEALKGVQGLNPEETLRYQRMMRVTGEPPTQGQLTRDFGQQQAENSMAKNVEVGGPLRQRLDSQNAGLIQSGKNLIDGLDVDVTDAYDVGKVATKFVQEYDKTTRRAVSQLYKAAERKALDSDLGMSPDGFLRVMDEIEYQDGAEKLLPMVQGWMRKQGLIDADGQLVRTGPNSTRGIEVNKIEELRKAIGNMRGSGLDAANQNRLVSKLINALDEDVMTWAGDDVYEGARGAAKARFRDLKIPGVKDLVEGDVAPEDFVDKFIRRGKIDDIEQFRAYTFRSKDPAARELWDSVKAQILREVMDNSVRRGSIDSLGNPEFTAVAMERALEKYGRHGLADRRLKAIFTAEERQVLNDMLAAAKDRVPVKGSFNPSGTAGELWNTFDRIINTLPMGSTVRMVLRGAISSAKQGSKETMDRDLVEEALKTPTRRSQDQKRDVLGGIINPPARSFMQLAPGDLRRQLKEENQ